MRAGSSRNYPPVKTVVSLLLSQGGSSGTRSGGDPKCGWSESATKPVSNPMAVRRSLRNKLFLLLQMPSRKPRPPGSLASVFVSRSCVPPSRRTRKPLKKDAPTMLAKLGRTQVKGWGKVELFEDHIAISASGAVRQSLASGSGGQGRAVWQCDPDP